MRTLARVSATIASAVGMTLIVSSCSAGREEAKERPRYPEVSVENACDGIFKGRPAAEIKKATERGKVYQIRPEESIEKEAEGAIDDSPSSNISIICSIRGELSETDPLIEINFRRQNGPPPLSARGSSEEKSYLLGERAVLREDGKTVRFDTLCRIPELADNFGEKNTIHLFMVDEVDLTIEIRANILASAAEKASSGLGCVNEVRFPEGENLKEIPRG